MKLKELWLPIIPCIDGTNGLFMLGIWPGVLWKLRTMLHTDTSLQKVRLQCDTERLLGREPDPRTMFIDGMIRVVKIFYGAEWSRYDPLVSFYGSIPSDEDLKLDLDLEQPVFELSRITHHFHVIEGVSTEDDTLVLTFERGGIEAEARPARDAVDEAELRKVLEEFCDRWFWTKATASDSDGE